MISLLFFESTLHQSEIVAVIQRFKLAKRKALAGMLLIFLNLIVGRDKYFICSF